MSFLMIGFHVMLTLLYLDEIEEIWILITVTANSFLYSFSENIWTLRKKGPLGYIFLIANIKLCSDDALIEATFN